MPEKYRELKAEMRRAGFTMSTGKGSHTNWRHRLLPGIRVTLSGRDGDDARHYHIDDVRKALAQLRQAEEREGDQ